MDGDRWKLTTRPPHEFTGGIWIFEECTPLVYYPLPSHKNLEEMTAQEEKRASKSYILRTP